MSTQPSRTRRSRAAFVGTFLGLTPFALAQESQDPTPLPEIPLTVSSPEGWDPNALPKEGRRDGIDGGAGISQPVLSPDDSVPLPIPRVVLPGADGDRVVREASGDPEFLGFTAGPYYPPKDERIDASLKARIGRHADDGRATNHTYAFVMLGKRITDARLDALESLGGRVLGLHPWNCVRIAFDPARLEAIASHPDVRWIGDPRSWQKLEPALSSLMQDSNGAAVLDIFINTFDTDLNPASEEILISSAADGEREVVVAAPEALLQGATKWMSNGWQQRALLELGMLVDEYIPQIQAFRCRATVAQIEAALGKDFVQYVERDVPMVLGHDESIQLVSSDVGRATYSGNNSGEAMAGLIDSGTQFSHEALNHTYWVSWNSSGGGSFSTDTCGHGSHVAGTILGKPPTVNDRFTGNAPDLGFAATRRYRNHRVFNGTGYGSCGTMVPSVSTAFGVMRSDYTDSSNNVSPRPHVVNNSWGAGGSWNGADANSRTLDSEVWTYDQLYVFAAGNDGSAAGTVGSPGVAKNAFTVGSFVDYQEATVGGLGKLWTSSSRGPTADGRWKPNVAAPGRWITSADSRSDTAYTDKSGTSMATPHVTGIAAQLVDHYSWLRYAPHRIAAQLMATAQTDGNITISTPTTTHLDQYGAGRVDSMRAHFSDADYTWSNWGYTQTNNWFYSDFTVPTGTTRMVAVMTYHEPAASSGASQALVKDIDFYLDQDPIDPAGNTGEWFAQQSSLDNTEIRIISNPAAGAWRWKTWPVNTSGSARVSVAIFFVTGNDTPTQTLAMTTSDQYVQVNEHVDITASASATDYVANIVWLDRTATGTSATTHNTEILLEDGIVVEAGTASDLVLGNAEDDDSRQAIYEMSWATEGVKTVSATATGQNSGSASASVNVTVDSTAPPTASRLVSTSHTVNQWSNDRTIDFTWGQAADSLSGVDGYGEFWSSSNPTGVGPTRDFGAVTSRTIDVGSDFTNVYYGLRTVDRSGNWSGEVTAGPYKIDTVLPALVTNLRSTSHTVNVWSNDGTIDFAWNAATDDRSGVDGYGEGWSSSAGVGVANIKDLEETVTTRTISRTSGATYYALRTVDNAGNWTATTAEIGPYLVDLIAPTGVSGLSSSTHTAGVWAQTGNITLNWAIATDGHSGVAGYDTVIDTSPGTVPAGTLDTPAGATTTNRVLGNTAVGWYFHIRPRDLAGNWGPVAHFGPILVDGVLPSGPSNLQSPTHTVGSWSNVNTVDFTWNAATDAHSGVSGLAANYDQTPGTDPGWPTNLAPSATSTSRFLATSTSGWYIHLRARDVAANWGVTQHLGPFFIDSQLPNGTITIDSGNATTISTAVTLGLTASDAVSGVDAIRLRNDGGSYSSWMPFAASLPWDLTNNGGSAGNGTRTVTLQVRDRAGNIRTVSDSIYLYVPTQYFGTACAGSLGPPSFLISGIAGLGRNVAFVPGNTAAPIGALYLGLSNTNWLSIPLPLDLGFLNVPGCFVNVELGIAPYTGAPITVPAAIPVDGLLVNAELYFQWLFLGDPSGKLVVTTRGAKMTISDL